MELKPRSTDLGRCDHYPSAYVFAAVLLEESRPMMRAVIVIVSAITIGCSTNLDPQAPLAIVLPAAEHTDTPLQSATSTDDATKEKNDVREELIQFIQSPDRGTYLAFREKIIASDAYAPYSDEIDTVGELYEQQKIEDARNVLQKAMGNLMLSPRAHQLLGFLHHKLGDKQAAQMEMMIGQACLKGILATGDGSANRPFIVVRTSDEHDVIEHLEKELKLQSLTHKSDKHFDLIQCTDGTEYWFDISDAYNKMSKSFGQ